MHVTRSASRASPRPCNRVRRVSARAHRRRSTGGPAGSQTPVLENINGSKKEGREEEGHEEDRQEGWRQEEDCPQGGKEAEVAGIAVAVCSMWNKEGGALHSYDQKVGLGSSRVPREITIPTGSAFAFRC